MEVVVPVMVASEFISDSTSSTPYASAPSSPRLHIGDWPPSSRHYYYTSAPTSPTRAAAIFREFSAAMSGGLASPRPSSHHRSSSVIPFEWEDAPGTPKSTSSHQRREEEPDDSDHGDDDFDFEFSGQLEMGGSSPLTADELFEEGMIRPLKLPPRLQQVPPRATGSAWEKGSSTSPRSPRSSSSPKSPKSPRSRLLFRRGIKDGGEIDDPFAKAMEETTRGRVRANPAPGRSTAQGGRRASRSVSPLRGVFDFGHRSSAHDLPYRIESVQFGRIEANHGIPDSPNSMRIGSISIQFPCESVQFSQIGANQKKSDSHGGAAAAARWIKGGSKKWRLRDLLLFRSASEGRATGSGGRDPLRKYTALSPSSTAMLSRKSSAASISSVSGGEDSKNGSFRSTDGGSVGGSSRRRSTAHERHYAAASRAAAEEMRRKTMLPYRQGLFGCLGEPCSRVEYA